MTFWDECLKIYSGRIWKWSTSACQGRCCGFRYFPSNAVLQCFVDLDLIYNLITFQICSHFALITCCISSSLNQHTDKPHLTGASHPNSTVLTEGNTLQLDCSAVGNPSPTYSWTGPSGVFPTKTSVLTINSTTTENKGQYTCFVSNNQGNVTVKFDVDVKREFEVLSCTVFYCPWKESHLTTVLLSVACSHISGSFILTHRKEVHCDCFSVWYRSDLKYFSVPFFFSFCRRLHQILHSCRNNRWCSVNLPAGNYICQILQKHKDGTVQPEGRFAFWQTPLPRAHRIVSPLEGVKCVLTLLSCCFITSCCWRAAPAPAPPRGSEVKTSTTNHNILWFESRLCFSLPHRSTDAFWWHETAQILYVIVSHIQ